MSEKESERERGREIEKRNDEWKVFNNRKAAVFFKRTEEKINKMIEYC